MYELKWLVLKIFDMKVYRKFYLHFLVIAIEAAMKLVREKEEGEDSSWFSSVMRRIAKDRQVSQVLTSQLSHGKSDYLGGITNLVFFLPFSFFPPAPVPSPASHTAL